MFTRALTPRQPTKEAAVDKPSERGNKNAGFCARVWCWNTFHLPWEPLAQPQGFQRGGFDHVRGGKVCGFQTFLFFFPSFQGMRIRNIAILMGQFFLSGVSFLSQSTKLQKTKKKSWNSNMTSGEHPTIWCFCLAFFLIAICLKSETGIFLLFFLFYFFDFFSTLYAYKQMLKCFTPCGSCGNRRLSINHRTSRRESKGLWGLRPLWQSIHKEVEKEGGWDREGVWPQSKAAGNHAEWRAWHLDPNGLGRLAR